MSDKPWKRFERKVSAKIGALRNIGSGSMGRADRSASDSTHETIFLEAKQRKKHSAVQLWRKTAKLAKKEGKTPIVAMSEAGMPGTWFVVHEDHVAILADAIDAASGPNFAQDASPDPKGPIRQPKPRKARTRKARDDSDEAGTVPAVLPGQQALYEGV